MLISRALSASTSSTFASSNAVSSGSMSASPVLENVIVFPMKYPVAVSEISFAWLQLILLFGASLSLCLF